jgi:hypothetical protein
MVFETDRRSEFPIKMANLKTGVKKAKLKAGG